MKTNRISGLAGVAALALLLAACPDRQPEVDPAAQPDPVPGAGALPEDTAPWRDTVPVTDGPLGPAPPERLAPGPDQQPVPPPQPQPE
jgi:hypothetical protein